MAVQTPCRKRYVETHECESYGDTQGNLADPATHDSGHSDKNQRIESQAAASRGSDHRDYYGYKSNGRKPAQTAGATESQSAEYHSPKKKRAYQGSKRTYVYGSQVVLPVQQEIKPANVYVKSNKERSGG
ncbi:hypothetical protein [Arthrobacter sp. OAP107]|uniref:hypothetical protein n=1 Tax=Arthrobacter sp. OAP107 TaxID=3156445 RepID=UPI0033958EA6